MGGLNRILEDKMIKIWDQGFFFSIHQNINLTSNNKLISIYIEPRTIRYQLSHWLGDVEKEIQFTCIMIHTTIVMYMSLFK